MEAKLELLRPSTEEVDGEQQYQGVPLNNLDAAVDQCKTHVIADVERLREKIQLDGHRPVESIGEHSWKRRAGNKKILMLKMMRT